MRKILSLVILISFLSTNTGFSSTTLRTPIKIDKERAAAALDVIQIKAEIKEKFGTDDIAELRKMAAKEKQLRKYVANDPQAVGYASDIPEGIEDAILSLEEAMKKVSPVDTKTRLAVKIKELARNSGLPFSISPSHVPAGDSDYEFWANALRVLHFEKAVYRRVEREGVDKERDTWKLAFANAGTDTDILELNDYDVSKEGLYSIRTGKQMRRVLMDPNAVVPPEAYFMHRGIFASREDIQKAFYDNKIRFDITVIPPADWRKEPAKTFGHFHNPVEVPEIYQVVSGEVMWLMQKCKKDGEVVDFVTVRAKAGDIAIMLPGYGHVSVNISETEPLVMANWLTWQQTSYYRKSEKEKSETEKISYSVSFEEKRGAAYYVVRQSDGQLVLVPNPRYKNPATPEQMVAKDKIPAFGLTRGEPIYNLVNRKDFAKKVRFLCHPKEYESLLTVDATLKKTKGRDLLSLEMQELKPVDAAKIVDDLLSLYRNKPQDEVARLDKLENIIRPAAAGVENYLYTQFNSEKIDADVYQKGMRNIIPRLADWYTNPDSQETTVLGIEESVKDARWPELAQTYFKDLPYGTAGLRGTFAFGRDFQKVAKAAKKGGGLQVPFLKGPNTFNDEVLRKFTLGVLRWLEQQNPSLERGKLKLFTAYDSRIAGKEFAQLTRDIGLAYGVKVYISDEAMPLPEFSCSLQKLSEGKNAIGIFVSASHNVKLDNGVKLIGSDGMQLGADAKKREAVKKEFRNAELKEVAELLRTKLPSDIPDWQLAFMGGEKKLPAIDYGKHELIDTHTRHAQAMRLHIGIIEKQHAKDIDILYCSFYGAGIKAMPRVLRANGFNVEIVDKMAELDGTFPEFDDTESPDPALVISWKKALQAYQSNHSRKELLNKDILQSSDPDADRFGLVIRVSKEEIPEDEKVAEAMGIVLKLSEEEQGKYGYGGWRVIPPNEWNALIAFYDLSQLKKEGKLDTAEQRKKHFLVYSHVTSLLMQKIADYFGIQAVITPVGVDKLAKEIVKLEKQGNIVVNGSEESGTYMTGDHIRDKDGFLAGIRIAEIACAAAQQEKTLNDLLDEMYLVPEIGFCATTNTAMEYEVSVPGTVAKIDAVKFLEKESKPHVEKMLLDNNHPAVGGYEIFYVDTQGDYRDGKYDEDLDYHKYPDAGIRFYFNEEKTSFITNRPSGTGSQLRFYAHLYYDTSGLDRKSLNDMKKNAYARCLDVTEQWIEVTEAKDIKKIRTLASFVPKIQKKTKTRHDL